MIHEDLNTRTRKDEIHEKVIFIIRYLTSQGFYAVGDESDDDTVERIMNNSGGWIEFATHGLPAGRLFFTFGSYDALKFVEVRESMNSGKPDSEERERLIRLNESTDEARKLYSAYEKVRQVFHRPLYS
jgi:hypothetical protein